MWALWILSLPLYITSAIVLSCICALSLSYYLMATSSLPSASYCDYASLSLAVSPGAVSRSGMLVYNLTNSYTVSEMSSDSPTQRSFKL